MNIDWVLKRDVFGKRVLFITTKNLDYIRNKQEMDLIQENASAHLVIGSYSRRYFVRLLIVFFKVLFTSTSHFDTVFIGFAPQLILPVFFWKFRKKEIIIDFFISLFDTFCHDRKKVEPDSVAGKLLHYIDKKTLFQADSVVCDTDAHGNYFCEEFQVPSEKLFTMYLKADTSIYHPLNVKRPDFLENKYVVLYFGSVLPLQGVDIVLKAVEILKDYDEFFFLLIGPMTKNKEFENIRPRSKNILYIDWLSQEKLAEYIDLSDLCLAGHFNDSIEKASRTIPGKAFIYQAMDKRMILGDNQANREVFKEGDRILFVQMGNAKLLAEFILYSLYNNS